MIPSSSCFPFSEAMKISFIHRFFILCPSNCLFSIYKNRTNCTKAMTFQEKQKFEHVQKLYKPKEKKRSGDEQEMFLNFMRKEKERIERNSKLRLTVFEKGLDEHIKVNLIHQFKGSLQLLRCSLQMFKISTYMYC